MELIGLEWTDQNQDAPVISCRMNRLRITKIFLIIFAMPILPHHRGTVHLATGAAIMSRLKDRCCLPTPFTIALEAAGGLFGS